MPKVLKRKDLLALDNFAIIVQARQAGLVVYKDDLYINYAEMDEEITSSEDLMVQEAKRAIEKAVEDFLRSVKGKVTIDAKSFNVGKALAPIYMNHIIRTWNDGQRSANRELETMGVETAGEFQPFRPGVQMFAAGQPLDPNEAGWLGNQDAYLWYSKYMEQLAQSTETALFHYMQPAILEHIDAGSTSTKLPDELEADFKRFGYVRTNIIARTESTKAYNWGRRYRFDASPGIAGYRYSAILDSRTTEICRSLHGQSWTKDDPALNLYTPPNHFQCRSIIVPINRYRDWVFDPPANGWDQDLPENEQKVLEKFTDFVWYPQPATVAAQLTPTTLPQPDEEDQQS